MASKTAWMTRWAGLALAAVGLSGCKSVHAELFVPASSAEVWSVLMAGDEYGAWNPVLVEVAGTFREGATMSYQMMTSDGTATPVDAEIVKLDPERELNQYGGYPGILTFDHHWILEPVEGGTQVTQHEDYAGVGVFFFDSDFFQQAYERGLEALRERVANPAARSD
ncbi:MAG: SRPBCC family protein [bacterium]|nr:SRPBCC family protein [bacterium]